MTSPRTTVPTARSLQALGPFDVPECPPPRGVRVFVPGGTATSRPLLVLFDGQNAFDDAPSFAGGWHAHVTTARVAKRRRGVAPVVVGVDHGNEHRIAELSPVSHGKIEGRAEAFIGWIARDLVPLLCRRYPVIDPSCPVVIGGSSMGGLGALYAHFRYPETFSGALVMSPSLFVGRGEIFRFVGSAAAPRRSKIYLDCGAHEAGGRMLAASERMAQLLRQKGYGTDRLVFRADPRGHHREASWRRRFPAALTFFFRDYW